MEKRGRGGGGGRRKEKIRLKKKRKEGGIRGEEKGKNVLVGLQKKSL